MRIWSLRCRWNLRKIISDLAKKGSWTLLHFLSDVKISMKWKMCFKYRYWKIWMKNECMKTLIYTKYNPYIYFVINRSIFLNHWPQPLSHFEYLSKSLTSTLITLWRVAFVSSSSTSKSFIIIGPQHRPMTHSL